MYQRTTFGPQLSVYMVQYGLCRHPDFQVSTLTGSTVLYSIEARIVVTMLAINDRDFSISKQLTYL